MKKLALLAAATITAGMFGMATAMAADPTFENADANKDGSVSMEEAQAVFPTLTPDLFTKADANADGKLDSGEFANLVGLSASLTTNNSSGASSAM